MSSILGINGQSWWQALLLNVFSNFPLIFFWSISTNFNGVNLSRDAFFFQGESEASLGLIYSSASWTSCFISRSSSFIIIECWGDPFGIKHPITQSWVFCITGLPFERERNLVIWNHVLSVNDNFNSFLMWGLWEHTRLMWQELTLMNY